MTRRAGSSAHVLITGASSGFGALAARALADAGHLVYAAMRDIGGRNATAAAAAEDYARQHDVDLRTVELDVADDHSVESAVEVVMSEAGHLDVVVHNAGHMVLGPSEAFAPEQLAALYDTNVLGTQRLNRAILPHLRLRRSGLLLWIGSSSFRGGTPPFLGPYFAAKAAMDALAVSYAAEVIRFGVETTILVPGPFTSGTQHFANAGTPHDVARGAEYEELYGGLQREIAERLASLEPPGTTIDRVADAIVRVVNRPRGTRPFRVHIDPSNDGAEVVSAVADRMRVEFFRRIGITDLLGADPSL